MKKTEYSQKKQQKDSKQTLNMNYLLQKEPNYNHQSKHTKHQKTRHRRRKKAKRRYSSSSSSSDSSTDRSSSSSSN
uniref:Uncharacterized protein n=1 Tax=TTV-like mini virus TaxID=93678 RepID=A0A286Q709_9VIRU|nr:hypothetical protein [TTV-like mini virus]